MWKKALLGTLAVILIAAVGFSIYNVMTAQASTAPVGTEVAAVAAPAGGPGAGQVVGGGAAAVPNQNSGQRAGAASGAGPGAQAAGGMGQGQRGPGQRGPGAGAGAGMNAGAGGSQAGLSGWQTLEGTVSGLAAPNFMLVTADGESIPVQLGNMSYANKIGLSLADGQAVTLVGAYEATGSLAVQSITVDGQTYDLRDATGRPLWAGRGGK